MYIWKVNTNHKIDFMKQPDFAGYAVRKKEELSVLEQFALPPLHVVAFDLSGLISGETIEHLDRIKKLPAVYYFTIEEDNKQAIYEAFEKAKKKSSETNRNYGPTKEDYKNICHVPEYQEPIKGNCLYVGSVRNNLLTRLRQHMGDTTSGRTGALYLKKVLEDMPQKPIITFNYHILKTEHKNLTLDIEAVLYKTYSPLLGKRL